MYCELSDHFEEKLLFQAGKRTFTKPIFEIAHSRAGTVVFDAPISSASRKTGIGKFNDCLPKTGARSFRCMDALVTRMAEVADDMAMIALKRKGRGYKKKWEKKNDRSAPLNGSGEGMYVHAASHFLLFTRRNL